ncbi:hypothetical protein KEJ27_08590 [Candidatus Bathyarchaeota archaeon]|nr:hypothetical protein [Candidatus Bathyarchaeota archaeon]MBS7617431.1 hypothetical protein [Candidatus Bathyarchaeota archaeon]
MNYQSIVEENIKLLGELDELERVRRAVMVQLGLVEDPSRLRAALIFQWLFRLYARRMGEAYVTKLVKGMT